MTPTELDLRHGTCPKCGSHDIRAQRRGFCARNFLPAGWWSRVRVENSACVDCGYLESCVDPAHLKRIARHWQRVKIREPA